MGQGGGIEIVFGWPKIKKRKEKKKDFGLRIVLNNKKKDNVGIKLSIHG